MELNFSRIDMGSYLCQQQISLLAQWEKFSWSQSLSPQLCYLWKILLLCHDVNFREEVRFDDNHLVCLKFYSPRCITYLSQNTLAYCITSSGVLPSTSLLIDSRSSLPYFSLAFINWLKSRLFHVVNPCNQDKRSVYCIVFYCIAMQFLTLLH